MINIISKSEVITYILDTVFLTQTASFLFVFTKYSFVE